MPMQITIKRIAYYSELSQSRRNPMSPTGTVQALTGWAADQRCWFPQKQEPAPSKGQSNPRSAKLNMPVPVTIT